MLICCPWAYGSSLEQLYPHYLGQILGFWVTCVVKIMSLHQCWGWQPPQTFSCIHNRHMQSVWAHWYAVHGYGSSLKQLEPYYLAHMMGFWVTCGVEMMSLHHDWGWQSPQTASCIHIRHIHSFWEHWYAVHGHKVVASNSYIPTLLGSDFGFLLGPLWSKNYVITSLLRVTSCIHISHIQSV